MNQDQSEQIANDPIDNLVRENMGEEPTRTLAQTMGAMLAPDQAVGELIDIDFEAAVVLIHDSQRQAKGGVPLGCFLVASRINPNQADFETRAADEGAILLRVTGRSKLPNADETSWARFHAGQRAIDSEHLWDHSERTDEFTLNMLRHGGLACRILGTFRLFDGRISFGSDIDNFYSGRAMKVFKPAGKALETIANFTTSVAQTGAAVADINPVRIGRVRYSATESPQANADIPVAMHPADIVARRTALFGMSRTGKSNTIKKLAHAIFMIRKTGEKKKIGQLIFDLNGEYAQDTQQDITSLRTLAQEVEEKDIATYGMFAPEHDKNRRITKMNFYGEEPDKWDNRENVDSALSALYEGHALIAENAFAQPNPPNYLKDFCNANLEAPDNIIDSPSSRIRYQRVIQVYRAALFRAGFERPGNLQGASLKGLFNKEVRDIVRKKSSAAADSLSSGEADWTNFLQACIILSNNIKQLPEGWADDSLLNVLQTFQYSGGRTALLDVRQWHASNEAGHYADDIVKDVREGRLVIVDQTLGSPSMNKSAAERIVRALFVAQQRDATANKQPPDVVVYAEEAHNLLPKSGDQDLTKIWPRIAKEGSKYQIGFIYATQEPTSILTNILKATDNWFISHLNSSDEVREIKKYYDFGDFEHQILQVAEPGFLRMRTLSNPYTIPIQVDKFSQDIRRKSDGVPE